MRERCGLRPGRCVARRCFANAFLVGVPCCPVVVGRWVGRVRCVMLAGLAGRCSAWCRTSRRDAIPIIVAGFAGRPSSRRGAGSAALAPARSRCGVPSARADSSRRAHVDPCISAAAHTDIATIDCLPAFQAIGVLPTMAQLHPRLLLPRGANEASLKPERTTLPDVLLVWTLMRLVWTLLRLAVLGSARPMHTKEVQNSSLHPKP